MKRLLLVLFALSLPFAASTTKLSAQEPGAWVYVHDEPGTWAPEWDSRPEPTRGACFYTDANFSGHRFCISAGQRMAFLPKGFGDKISSIRTYGGGMAIVYGKQRFGGKQGSFGTIQDLRYSGEGGKRGWNDRISSLAVN